MLLLMGADKTAIAEFDSCGGSEAARLATAEGDNRDGCCWWWWCGQEPAVGAWDTSASPGSSKDIGMVLPEACMDGDVSQAGAGGLDGILAKGVCPADGSALAANGEAAGKSASGALCSEDCWEYRPVADPGMLNCLGRLPEGSEPYAERGELARSMGIGGRR